MNTEKLKAGSSTNLLDMLPQQVLTHYLLPVAVTWPFDVQIPSKREKQKIILPKIPLSEPSSLQKFLILCPGTSAKV